MNPRAIQRLLSPRSIAMIGGAWADAAVAASRAIGYEGKLWRIHPQRPSSPETPYYRSVDELPGVPDAAFIAAPNSEVPEIAAALARSGAGGFVCFAAGFSETGSAEGQRLTERLLANAAELPFFGPNCYGFINFFDGVALWPDQVVGYRPERGVALICQSGTIALNLIFGDRSLPIGYVLTVGNQTRLAVEDMIELLTEEDRVTRLWNLYRGHQASGRLCARSGQGARGRQADRAGQGRAHRSRRAHRAQSHRFARRCRCRVRCVLPAGGHCALRLAGHAVRDAEDVPHRWPASRPARAGNGRFRRRHGDDGGRLATAGTEVPAVSCGVHRAAACSARRPGHHRQPIRFPHPHLVRPPGACDRCSPWCGAPDSTR